MKGVIYMLDIEKLMREGKSLDEIGKIVTAEMNATHDKIEAEEKAKAEAEKEKKKEAAAQAEKVLKEKREAVVAAFTSYITLVLGEEISEDIVRASIVELEESIAAIKKIRISVNGDDLKSIFDLFL